MRRQLLRLGCSLVGVAFLSGLAACSGSNKSHTDGGGQMDSKTPPSDVGQGCAGDPNLTYVLIDDMETTDHGPIDLDAGISPPLAAGYWYNSGAGYTADSGVGIDDTSNPPQRSFAFTALPTPTKTLNCKVSAHAARQYCMLDGLYDTCGVGFEFAQVPIDGGATSPGDAAASDAGDGGPSIPRVTVPFDISGYKAVTFWGMTTTPDPTKGTLQVKMQFPDPDTDPRGKVCNGGGGDNSQCYNSYATNFAFTTSWQQFTVLLDAGDGGTHPDGGIRLDPTFGYQDARWLPTMIYGINWQAQKNTPPGDAGPAIMTDIWIDDVYFIK
jgi:hypothetical protein